MDNYANSYLGTHYVKYTLQYKDYTGSFVRAVGGNCRGADVMDADIFDSLNQNDINLLYSNDCHLTYDEEFRTYSFILKNQNGESCEFEEYEDEMSKYLVAVEIIGFTPE